LAFGTWVLVIVTVATVVNSYLIWKIFQHLGRTEEAFRQKIRDLDIDSKLTSAFSSGKSVKSVDVLANTLFHNVKDHFHFGAHSYTELIDEIRASPKITAELKDSLTDFFNEMIRLSYMQESIGEDEKVQLRKKIKVILRKIQNI